MVNKLALIILVLSWFVVTSASALTVDEAYRAIPHRQTVFIAQQSRMPQEDKTFLVEFFNLIDQAIVERVQMQSELNSGNRSSLNPSAYDQILEQLKMMPVPSKFENIHQLVYEAIEDQGSYLEGWKNSGKSVAPGANAWVQSASQKLHQAYQLFMDLYPQESQHNKDAFFDYLCALDFI